MNALKEFFSKFSGLPEDSLLAFLKLASKKSIKRHKKNLTKAEKKDFKPYRGQGK